MSLNVNMTTKKTWKKSTTSLLALKTPTFISLLTRPTVAIACLLPFIMLGNPATAQDEDTRAYNADLSMARNWNEALLFAIRRDFARPTVHARNLFHTSAAMYDSWALFDETPSLYFLGRTVTPDGSPLPECQFSTQLRQSWRTLVGSDLEQARMTTLSYAMYRLLRARFARSPGAAQTSQRIDALFAALQLDPTKDSTDINTSSDPAHLGNYLANCVITYGMHDGANEANDYTNQFYATTNPPLDPNGTGNPGLSDPNRWQPLQLDTFIDQSGNPTDIPAFIGAEWSAVAPFALQRSDISQVPRDSMTYPVYLDPGPPDVLSDDSAANRAYLLGHALVAKWSSHLDATDGVSWDISPGTFGNAHNLPEEGESALNYYDALNGGTQELGYAVNPITGDPYEEVVVPRGDFTRVLAEFWADGPDSETPPGHWFQIYNTLVSDHPDFNRRFAGEDLEPLEYDIRTYFVLGAAMHDSAIAAWSAKSAYDYIRPISALRYMASLGQSSDLTASNYHVHGIPLEPGLIETIEAGDPLAGNGGVNIGRIKSRTWRGPNFIRNPETDVAGVGWILLENWWPYQRPSFVTPPFAGYVSGHSTFSRAAADILSSLTGSEYFPGGLAQFIAPRNDFLVFERGPSVDVTLQWASYRDASDQTSLSRIWGGIHPPVDDLPGRRLGSEIAARTWTRAQQYFVGQVTHQTGLAEQVDTTVPSGSGSGSGSGCSLASGSRHGGDLLMWLLFAAVLRTIQQTKSTIRPECFA